MVLVTRLADQHQGEAGTQVEAIRVRTAEQHAQYARVQSDLAAGLADARQALGAVSQQLPSGKQDHAGVSD